MYPLARYHASRGRQLTPSAGPAIPSFWGACQTRSGGMLPRYPVISEGPPEQHLTAKRVEETLSRTAPHPRLRISTQPAGCHAPDHEPRASPSHMQALGFWRKLWLPASHRRYDNPGLRLCPRSCARPEQELIRSRPPRCLPMCICTSGVGWYLNAAIRYGMKVRIVTSAKALPLQPTEALP